MIGQSSIQNLSVDELDIDVAVDPSELLPPNGTQQISTEGATDIDVNSFPPAGVTIIIENETVHVTNRPVTIGRESIPEQQVNQRYILEKHKTDVGRWLKHLCQEEFDSHIVITMKS